MNINGFDFIKTCDCCPEQYDVIDENGKQVAYIRLRFGNLSCECTDVGGEEIFYYRFDNDMQGCFDNEIQRKFYLESISDKIKHFYKF